MHDLYVTSEGERANYPRFLRKSELDYKLYFRGKKLVKVGKWFASSQLCSKCGYKNAQVKDMKVREWKCPLCGTEHDRDINAAINICEEGKRITVGTTGSNAYGEDVRRLQPVTLVGAQSSLK